MSSLGLLSIFLGFLLMILIIANGLLARGILMSRKQKINIFLDEFKSMNKDEKVKFINEYSSSDFKLICELFNS
jgi:hypothetical protein